MQARQRSRRDRAGKGVLIWGGFGGVNLGDEAILYSVVQMIRKSGHSGRISVLCHGSPPTKTTREEYAAWGIECICLRRNPIRALLQLASDNLIVGGGQLVDDSSWLWPIGYASVLILVNRITLNSPTIRAVGALPLTRFPHRFCVRHLLSLALNATCRDKYSADALLEAGYPRDKVSVTADFVFGSELEGLVVPPQVKRGATVVLVVSNDPGKGIVNVEQAERIARHLLDTQSQMEHLVIMGHDVRTPESHGQTALDLAGLAILRSRLDDSRIEYATPQTLGAVVNLYSQATAVISARMHPLIMGMVLGAYPFAMKYSAKVNSLCEMFDIPVVATQQPSQICFEKLELLRALWNGEQSPYRVPDEVKERAWENIATLTPLFGDKTNSCWRKPVAYGAAGGSNQGS